MRIETDRLVVTSASWAPKCWLVLCCWLPHPSHNFRVLIPQPSYVAVHLW